MAVGFCICIDLLHLLFLTVVNKQYENLRIQASTMKQKYEDRISDLEDEAETLTARIKDLEQQLLQTRQQVQLQQEQFQQQQEQLQQQQQRLQQAASAAGSGGGGDVAAEVGGDLMSVDGKIAFVCLQVVCVSVVYVYMSVYKRVCTCSVCVCV